MFAIEALTTTMQANILGWKLGAMHAYLFGSYIYKYSMCYNSHNHQLAIPIILGDSPN